MEEHKQSTLHEGDEVFDKVTPYAIMNLTSTTLKVVPKNSKPVERDASSMMSSITSDKISATTDKGYELKTGDKCDYAVEYEQ